MSISISIKQQVSKFQFVSNKITKGCSKTIPSINYQNIIKSTYLHAYALTSNQQQRLCKYLQLE